MEPINAMKITGITLTDFRNHKKPASYVFGDVSYIIGHNGTGKTTVAHGICYALYGVSYYGEQKIERLMNETAAGTQARLDFIDQNGTSHTLVRSRSGDKTTLLLDSYTVRQSDIDRMFCDKETFLSMFNPTFLAERSGERGRELILRYLKPVAPETVLAGLGSFREDLDGFDLMRESPEALMKNCREAIRCTERQAAVLEGNISSIQEAVSTAGQKLASLYAEKSETENRLSALQTAQFRDIDMDDLTIQCDFLRQKLMEESGEDDRISALQLQIAQTRQKTYASQYTQAQTETQAEIRILSQKFKALKERYQTLRPGIQCPTCLVRVTDQSLSEIKNSMAAELQSLLAKGRGLIDRGRELEELDRKARDVFEQFQSDDIRRLSEELAALKRQAKPNRGEIHAQLTHLEEQMRYGNLTEEEYRELSALQAEAAGIEAKISAVKELADEQKLADALAEKAAFDMQAEKYRRTLAALVEYVCKRTELAVQQLTMPHTAIQLYDVARSTGEMINVFRFTYNGRDYSALSLSEKTLAGLELAAMMRRLTGIDCPVCIDNTESIAAFHAEDMPSQTLLLRFIKGRPLTVQTRNSAVSPVRELKKAS